MFKVTKGTNSGNWSITDENRNYMHGDGSVFHRCGEYWPTREQAQAVLDKYQPPHVWEHGDVFQIGKCIMMYLSAYPEPAVIHLNVEHTQRVWWNLPGYLTGATFLFNIKDKLGDS